MNKKAWRKRITEVLRCAQCGDSGAGVTLVRINPKGEDGIFICQEICGGVITDPETAFVVSLLRGEWESHVNN